MEVTTNRISFLCGTRKGYPNTDLGNVDTFIGQYKTLKDEQHGPRQKT